MHTYVFRDCLVEPRLASNSEDGLELPIPVPPPPVFWDYTRASPCLIHTVLGNLIQPSCMLSKQSTKWATSQPYIYYTIFSKLVFSLIQHKKSSVEFPTRVPYFGFWNISELEFSDEGYLAYTRYSLDQRVEVLSKIVLVHSTGRVAAISANSRNAAIWVGQNYNIHRNIYGKSRPCL